ncbi:MAG: PLP-dependent aminotransferase family protein [Nitrincola lacisaponensis]|uniref:aminotransferase-like domain-containing protein n=1 Tax=Nitrincola lacisaponensis TaxID=267850 RepID=UPI003919B64A
MNQEYAYLALESWLLQQLQTGRWQVGERLPSVRMLCRERGVSKATVIHAYQRLEAQGRIEARPRSGYFVCAPLAAVRVSDRSDESTLIPQPVPVTSSELLTDIMMQGAAFDLLPGQQAPYLPAGLLLLNRAIARALRQSRGVSHQSYEEPAGFLPLRQLLAQRYQRDACQVTADQLCITSGCQNALYLALKASCQPGDLVAVESPGFYGVIQLLESLQLKVIEIPASSSVGMDVKALARALMHWPIRACVVTPSFATPGGTLMPRGEQQDLLDLAERYDLVVIEDDIYRELSFTGRISPLKSLDTRDRVILCGSYSKTLSRDLRLGWAISKRWHARIVYLKLMTQLASSHYVQQGLYDYLNSGEYDRYLRHRVTELYGQAQDWIAAIQMRWQDQIVFDRPQGGLCLWVTWQCPIDTLALYPRALQQNVALTPGPLFSASGDFRQALRLSFAQPCTAAHEAALDRLQGLMHQ